MRTSHFAIAAAALTIITTVSNAEAGANDYEFQPVITEVKNGAGSEVVVRLIHKPDGKAVSGALLFRSRLDMSPENMGNMTAKLTAEPSAGPGLYRFKAETTMAGSWALKLMAKVPGESETIEGMINVQAKD